MPRLAANLSLLFADRPLPERFAAARRAGFDEVEIQFPYSHSIPELATACQAAGVRVVLINLPAGDLMQGGDGLALARDLEGGLPAWEKAGLPIAR